MLAVVRFANASAYHAAILCVPTAGNVATRDCYLAYYLLPRGFCLRSLSGNVATRTSVFEGVRLY